jgi:ABC-type transporter Mla subunit MlaD
MNTASNRTKPTARRWTLVVLSLTSVALVAACGSSNVFGSNTSPTPATSAPASNAGGSVSGSAFPCAQISGLRSTLTDITNTSVSPTSIPRLASDLAKAEQELNTLKNQAGPFAAQANQLSNELNSIKSSADSLAKNPTPTNLSNLTSAVNGFKSTAQPLIKEIQAACP